MNIPKLKKLIHSVNSRYETVQELKTAYLGACSNLSAEVSLLGAELSEIEAESKSAEDPGILAGQIKIPFHEARAFIKHAKSQKLISDESGMMRQTFLLFFVPEEREPVESCKREKWEISDNKLGNWVGEFMAITELNSAQEDSFRAKLLPANQRLWPDKFKPHIPSHD